MHLTSPARVRVVFTLTPSSSVTFRRGFGLQGKRNRVIALCGKMHICDADPDTRLRVVAAEAVIPAIIEIGR